MQLNRNVTTSGDILSKLTEALAFHGVTNIRSCEDMLSASVEKGLGNPGFILSNVSDPGTPFGDRRYQIHSIKLNNLC